MYRQGLGDCFLLTFRPGEPDEAHVLIDIGSIGKGIGIPMPRVVQDIAETTGRHLAVVVATHEHADHLSGFQQLLKAGVKADEAWFAWTEDPSDPLAREIEKYKGDLFAATEQAAAALDRAQRARAEERAAMRDDPIGAKAEEQRFAFLDALNAGVRDLLAFEGLAAADEKGGGPTPLPARGALKERLNGMMEAARTVAGKNARYFSPGTVIERNWAPGARFFVLGPPRDARAIQRLGEHGSPDLYELAFVTGAELPSAAGAPSDHVEHDSWEPFRSRVHVHDRERRGEGAGRRGGGVPGGDLAPGRRGDARGKLPSSRCSSTTRPNNTSLAPRDRGRRRGAALRRGLAGGKLVELASSDLSYCPRELLGHPAPGGGSPPPDDLLQGRTPRKSQCHDEARARDDERAGAHRLHPPR